jgi:hypothetical protein
MSWVDKYFDIEIINSVLIVVAVAVGCCLPIVQHDMKTALQKPALSARAIA